MRVRLFCYETHDGCFKRFLKIILRKLSQGAVILFNICLIIRRYNLPHSMPMWVTIMKTLLLTGATGFLGGAVLEKLLIEKQSINYLLLVRADDAQQGLARIRANMEKFNIDANLLSKITIENILLGDLSEPADFLTDARINNVTHVINCAAVASFGNNPLIWKVNVEGTLAFAERMAQVPGLKRFLHVGTAMSCSPEPGSLVAESGEWLC